MVVFYKFDGNTIGIKWFLIKLLLLLLFKYKIYLLYLVLKTSILNCIMYFNSVLLIEFIKH